MRRVSGRRTVVTGNDRSSDTRALELQAALEIPFERAQIQLRAGVVLAASAKRDLALEQPRRRLPHRTKGSVPVRATELGLLLG